MKRTLEISREGAHLAVRNHQLLVKRDGAVVGSIPCEDIGVVLVDHPQTTYTHGALASLAASDAAVIICGDNHLPSAILLPLSTHSQVVWRLNDQLAVGLPLAKQLWKQIVVAKVRAQAANLPAESSARKKLLALAREVKSGDPMNIEAQAARIYWQNWLSPGSVPNSCSEELGSDPLAPHDALATIFRRDPDGAGLNAFLNYGYAVVRAAVARAIVGAGLLPSLGVHHKHRGNAFCLADDLMEPLRPLVDDRVRDMHRQGYDQLNQPAKAALLEVLTQPLRLGDQTGPLMVMLHRLVASLVRCYAGESRTLEIPTPLAEPICSPPLDGDGSNRAQSPVATERRAIGPAECVDEE